jgi:hypothetical protein
MQPGDPDKAVNLPSFDTLSSLLLDLKPTHALILKYTFASTFIKRLKLVKNVL